MDTNRVQFSHSHSNITRFFIFTSNLKTHLYLTDFLSSRRANEGARFTKA